MFTDREQAGKRLAARLADMQIENPVVLALPRGGVPVGAEVSQALNAPLGLLLVRKIGVPFQPELAAGAVVDGDEPGVIINDDVVRATGMSQSDIDSAVAKNLAEIERRRSVYYGENQPLDVAGKSVIVVDDGIATGATMKAGLKGLRRRNPARTILAVPVAPAETLDELGPEVDDIVCLETPAPFFAIGAHYIDFRQLSDDEVSSLLDVFRQQQAEEPTNGSG